LTDHPAPAGLRWLPAFLFRAGRWPAYLVKAWLLALVPSILLAGLVALLFAGNSAPDFGPVQTSSDRASLVVALVLIGPLIETLIMGAVLLILRRLFGFTAAVLLSALGWGLAHSFGGLAFGGGAVPAWGLVVWWPFLILSIAFLTWRTRGILAGGAMATAIHGLQNSLPALALTLASAAASA